jgi:DNA-binding MarR family transcriptional regulator
MTSPNHPVRPAIGRTLQAYAAFEQRLMAVHAPEFTAFDLTMAQAKLLYVVTATGDLSMSEIAQRLGVTISTASGAVDHLVSIGLLNRIDDPANRRQVQVSVTPYGRQTLEAMRELNIRQLRALLDLVGDADLEVVERAIRILTDAISIAEPTTRSHS